MHNAPATRKKFVPIAFALLGPALAGVIYPFFFVVPYGPVWHAHVNGFLVGCLIGVALLFGELYLFNTRIRRLRFLFFTMVQTAYYVLAINIAVVSVMISHNILFHASTIDQETSAKALGDFFGSEAFLTINAYSLVLVFGVSFLRSINRMLGQNAMLFFFTGKYHRPVEEERVFMFLDLKSSTTIAEKLGHTRYHAFLNDVFFDITPSIVESRGKIYQYIGDEVVVTWTREAGLADTNCVDCYRKIESVLSAMAARYAVKYGFSPTFKAGCHYGVVTAGLIGDIKRDIVYHGDTVNTAARIRSECSIHNRNLLMSGQLLSRLQADALPAMEKIGRIRLRGKEEEIELYAMMQGS
jgi:adenylate cyclase